MRGERLGDAFERCFEVDAHAHSVRSLTPRSFRLAVVARNQFRVLKEPPVTSGMKNNMGKLLVGCGLICMLFGSSDCLALTPDESVNINQQVRSLLSNKCFACHGPDSEARAADLRLDTREGALDWAIDLDDPESSEVIQRVTSEDEDTVMPPPKHGKALTKSEVDLLKKWIADGAQYVKHWSYESPAKAPIQPVGVEGGNEIDGFILAKLKQRSLSFSERAERTTLIRRLALDVTGLPPTPEEVAQFVEDSSPDAYEKLVDYYLAQDSFGERWASVWLDLARYADSAGYAEDKPRTIWAFRDYVIESYNRNVPFDQFTIEQLAGDLMENATDETRIATAFHRNTLTNSEGGTSDEEFRSAAVVDRVNTTMAVWMGTTMACAQCHTHKYDPITQHEYFQFYDFLNQTADNDRPNETPVLPVYSPEQNKQREQLQKKLEALAKRLETVPSDEELSNARTRLIESFDKPVKGNKVIVSLPGKNRILSLAEVQVFTRVDGELKNVATEGKAKQSSVGYGGPAKLANDGNTEGNFEKKSVTHTNSESNPWWELTLNESVEIESIHIFHRTDNNLSSRSNGLEVSVVNQLGESVWATTVQNVGKKDDHLVVQPIPSDLVPVLSNKASATPEQTKRLDEIVLNQARLAVRAQSKSLQKRLDAIRPRTTVPVLEELPEKSRRVTKVQIRGNFLDTGDTVVAGTPEVFHPFPEGPRNRLTLAKWLVDEKNPLTARVIVNRYWEQIFGVGLVETSEEFGAQGELPSHPKLLDWLAVDFVENGWDRKRLVKQLVMSFAYQQTSKASSDLLELDPRNRLLARGPRNRLTAEMIRDQALAVSGLLSKKMYGAPVQPPQPKVGLKPAFTGKTTDWTDSVGENRYRRGIYTEWRRSAPYPSMSTFDVNNREVCEVRRVTTNTPLQALVTLNDPVYVEAAQALARRVVGATCETTEDRVKLTFQSCLIREPSAAEIKRILALYEMTRKHFESATEDAKLLATDPLNPPSKDADLVELATWTTIANVILNLDEMLMKP